MNYKIFSFGFLMLLIVGFVSAVPPQTFSGTNGLQVEFPDFEFFMVNTAFSLPFHVYSLQDGQAVNTSVVCTLHVYNGLGDHIYVNTSTVPTPYDYEFVLPNNTFNLSGEYRFLAYCVCDSCGSSGETLGGFAEHNFEITNDGKDYRNNWFAIIGIIAIFLFAWLLLKITFSLDESHFLLKLFFLICVLFLGVLGLNFGLTVVNSSFVSSILSNNLTSIYRWSLHILWVFIAYIFVQFIRKIFENKNWFTGGGK